MAGCCSLLVLCCGGVAALSSLAMLAIALNTDHWTEITVQRGEVEQRGLAGRPEQRFYTRSTGLFRVSDLFCGTSYYPPIQYFCKSQKKYF